MDNTHLPSGGDEHASRPTEQFWSGPGPAGPSGDAGYGTPGSASGHSASGHSAAGHSAAGHSAPGHGGAGYGPQATWYHEAGPWQGGPWQGGPWQGGPSYGGPGRPHDPRNRRRTLSWGAGLALVALLAGGGVIAGVTLAGNSPPAQPAASSGAVAPGAAAAAGPSGQAAVLSAALSAAGSPAGPAYLDSSGAVASVAAGAASGAGTSGVAGAAGPAARCLRARAAARAAGRPGLARRIRIACLRPALRRLALRGVHGEFTFRAGDGFKTVAFERGTIQSVSGQDIVVRAPDGTTWTWNLVSSTVVRENGSKVSTGALAAGEQVWTGGPVVQGTRDSRLIVIRPPSGSPAPSPSAG